jgi:effector-binding domain-containing protein
MGTNLQSEPKIVERAEQPYAGITGTVSMQEIPRIADRLPEVFGWLATKGIAPAAAPFFRYAVIDMASTLVIEVGVPVAEPVQGEGDIRGGVLPAGRYVTVSHRGHPDELVDVTGGLLDWAAAQGLTWDKTDEPDGEHWVCRLEIYNDDPREQPDWSQWTTDLVFKLSDG